MARRKKYDVPPSVEADYGPMAETLAKLQTEVKLLQSKLKKSEEKAKDAERAEAQRRFDPDSPTMLESAEEHYQREARAQEQRRVDWTPPSDGTFTLNGVRYDWKAGVPTKIHPLVLAAIDQMARDNAQSERFRLSLDVDAKPVGAVPFEGFRG
jgi:hypothetical protein